MGNDVVEIDLKGLVSGLWNNRLTIFLSTILVAAIFLSSSIFFITPQYEAKSELYVLSKSTSVTSLTDLQIGTSLSDDYTVVVGSRSVLLQVIDNLGLDETYQELQEQTSTSMLSDRIIEISVKNPSAEQAVLIAQEIAEVSAAYISQKMQQDPPSIIEHAYTDNEKVEPSLSRNTLIGAIFGFMIAAILVTISVMLNDSVMTREDVMNKLGLNVLGTLPLEHAEYDGGKIRRTPKEILKSIFVETSVPTANTKGVLKKKQATRGKGPFGSSSSRKKR